MEKPSLKSLRPSQLPFNLSSVRSVTESSRRDLPLPKIIEAHTPQAHLELTLGPGQLPFIQSKNENDNQSPFLDSLCNLSPRDAGEGAVQFGDLSDEIRLRTPFKNHLSRQSEREGSATKQNEETIKVDCQPLEFLPQVAGDDEELDMPRPFSDGSSQFELRIDSDTSTRMEVMNEICMMGSEEMEKLKLKLTSNNIFMNMVIHDMRNPTVSAKMGLQASLGDIHCAQAQMEQALLGFRELHSHSTQLSSCKAELEASLQELRGGEQQIQQEFPGHLEQAKDALLSDLSAVFLRHGVTIDDGIEARLKALADDAIGVEQSRDSLLYSIDSQNLAQATTQLVDLPSIKRAKEALAEAIHAIDSLKFEEPAPLAEAMSLMEKSESMLQSQLASQSMMEILINDLLDHAKMENQSFTFNREYFDLAATIEEAFTILAHSATERRIRLRAVIESQCSLKYIRSILGDKRRYLQVLLNFISNSLKFTNEGGEVAIKIKVLSLQQIQEYKPGQISEETCTLMPKSSKSKQRSALSRSAEFGTQKSFTSKKSDELVHGYFISFSLSVVDTGVGISNEGLNHLFVDFGKLDEGAHRNQAGTGLGLSICKKIIEQMGGKVGIESEMGVGTTFKISLNSRCEVQGQLEIGITDIESQGSNSELTLMDKTHDEVPIQSFYPSHHQPQQLPKFKSIIESPLKFKKLKSDDRCQRRQTEVVPNKASAMTQDTEVAEIKCLLANDEVMQLQVLQMILKRADITVTTALNGHEAFEKIRRGLRDQIPKYDVIILDLNMPICDGYQACQQINNLYSDRNFIEVESSSLSFSLKQRKISQVSLASSKKAQLSLTSSEQKPLLVALSSYVDAYVEKRTKEVGFDLTIQSPLTTQILENTIKPLVASRRDGILRRLKLIHFYEEKVKLLKNKKRSSCRNFDFLLQNKGRRGRGNSQKLKQQTTVSLTKFDPEKEYMTKIVSDVQSPGHGSTTNLGHFKVLNPAKIEASPILEDNMEEMEKISSQIEVSESCSAE